MLILIKGIKSKYFLLSLFDKILLCDFLYFNLICIDVCFIMSCRAGLILYIFSFGFFPHIFIFLFSPFLFFFFCHFFLSPYKSLTPPPPPITHNTHSMSFCCSFCLLLILKEFSISERYFDMKMLKIYSHIILTCNICVCVCVIYYCYYYYFLQIFGGWGARALVNDEDNI